MNKSKTLLVFLSASIGFWESVSVTTWMCIPVGKSLILGMFHICLGYTWDVPTWDVPYMPDDCLRDPKIPKDVADDDYLTVSRCPTVQLLGGRRRPTFLCILKAELLES